MMTATASAQLKSGIHMGDLDQSVRPADDFYEYACGGWMKANPLPAAYSRYGSFDRLAEDNNKRINSILKANAETSGEKLSRTIAASIAADVFNRLTAENEIITTAETRECVDRILQERGYTETARRYREYKKT